MKPRNLKIVIFAVVLAVILIAGGVTYVSVTAVNAAKYQTVSATVVEISTEKKDENTVIVTGVAVRYETAGGVVQNKLSGQFPKELKEGSQISVRYKKDDVTFVTAEHVDWGTPIFLLVLGVLYAVGSGVFIYLRKKAGDYAIYDGTVEGDGVFEDAADEESEPQETVCEPEIKK
ncbi:MAG: DUF3592 domain-containing protein [Corallococcus sp.]|nr:DUF3592 domain-containing protein [Corallococcus sp.]MCM1360144.1 DUF3592 domain-containing protein [Corallococcus sp.]MCM1395468.1 DUF3592 domain-containing protein [Corallococcus sp.]